MEKIIEQIALVAAIVLPLFNLPLMVRMVKRKSSKDISLHWAVGVWVCLLMMFPAAILSPDQVWRIFSIINIVMFSAVVYFVIKYRGTNREKVLSD